jgi:F-type H+-transporting ATPase subunit a
VLLTLFISAIKLLVAFIQAYVFTLLSALFIGMAVAAHEHEEHEAESTEGPVVHAPSAASQS